MSSGAPSTLRRAIDEHLARAAGELEARLDAEASAREAVAARAVSERLNQAVRRLREARDFAAAAPVLLDAAGAFCNGAALFRVTDGNQVAAERARGIDAAAEARFGALQFPAEAGAVFAAVLAGSDPLVTMSSTGELPPGVVEALGHAPEQRIALFPIVAGGKAAGLLCAWGEPQMAALELLTQAAGMALAALPPEVQPAALVGIAPAAPPARSGPPAPDWTAMSAGDRKSVV